MGDVGDVRNVGDAGDMGNAGDMGDVGDAGDLGDAGNLRDVVEAFIGFSLRGKKLLLTLLALIGDVTSSYRLDEDSLKSVNEIFILWLLNFAKSILLLQ
jgi:hypothetical protein